MSTSDTARLLRCLVGDLREQRCHVEPDCRLAAVCNVPEHYCECVPQTWIRVDVAE